MASGHIEHGGRQLQAKFPQYRLAQLGPLDRATGQTRRAEHQQPIGGGVLQLHHRLPERSCLANGGQAGEGSQVIGNAIGVPALYRQLLQWLIIDHPAPVAPVSHQ